MAVLIGVGCGTHRHLASHLPYLSLHFFKGCGSVVIPSKGAISPGHTPSATQAASLWRPHMAWPGPLARVLWRPHFLEPHQAGCGLNGRDHQITGQLMVEIRCKYARRPHGEL